MKSSAKFKLERCIEGSWYEWGTFKSVHALVRAAAELGVLGYGGDSVRVELV